MRSKLLFTILATTMLIATALQSAEIIPIWNKESGAGVIQDMEIMPGGNEFMLTTTGGEIQIRDVLTGDTIRAFRDNSSLFMNGNFEFTPDSTRLVMGESGLLQLVNLENFERIKYVALADDLSNKKGSVYLGIQNRRTDPLIFRDSIDVLDAISQDTLRELMFFTAAEFDDKVRYGGTDLWGVFS